MCLMGMSHSEKRQVHHYGSLVCPSGSGLIWLNCTHDDFEISIRLIQMFTEEARIRKIVLWVWPFSVYAVKNKLYKTSC